VVDVSNSTAPVLVGSVTFGGSTPALFAVYVQGKYAYVADQGDNVLQIVEHLAQMHYK
jgi:hypothetical protein